MSVGRVSVVEFKTEAGVEKFSKDYAEQYHENFPTAEASIAIRTGATSALGMTIYPNEEAQEENEKRQEMRKQTIEETGHSMVEETMGPILSIMSEV